MDNQFSDENSTSANGKDLNAEKFLEKVGKTNQLLETLIASNVSQENKLEKLKHHTKRQNTILGVSFGLYTFIGFGLGILLGITYVQRISK